MMFSFADFLYGAICTVLLLMFAAYAWRFTIKMLYGASEVISSQARLRQLRTTAYAKQMALVETMRKDTIQNVIKFRQLMQLAYDLEYVNANRPEDLQSEINDFVNTVMAHCSSVNRAQLHVTNEVSDVTMNMLLPYLDVPSEIINQAQDKQLEYIREIRDQERELVMLREKLSQDQVENRRKIIERLMRQRGEDNEQY